MSVYIVTGKLGAGKSLVAVGKIQEALRRGKRVATNIDIYPEALRHKNCRATVLRLPDKPTAEHLAAIGTGDGRPEDDTYYNEDDFGILVLDELGTWLNARAWGDKERGPVLDWFIHARKKRWHVFLLVQDVSLLDAQARSALCEHLVICKRLDRMKIPWPFLMIAFFIVWMLSAWWVGFVALGIWSAFQQVWQFKFGRKFGLPRMHIANVHYGDNRTAMIAERWWFRGSDLFKGYRTGQVFAEDVIYWNGQRVDMRAPYTVLSSWHLRGRYAKPFRFTLGNILGFAARLIIYSLVTISAWASGRSPEAQAKAWGMLRS